MLKFLCSQLIWSGVLMAQTAPYGSWKSPITADVIVEESVRLGEVCVDGDTIYYSEMRPSEKGRTALLRALPDGSSEDVLPREYNVRTKVHEYGGGSFHVADGVVYFSQFSNQQMYRMKEGKIEQVTDQEHYRYADMRWDATRSLLYCVCEEHTEDEVNNFIVKVDPESKEVTEVEEGNDFYSSPRIKSDGSHLCYITWNHPNMPWDGTELWVHPVAADGTLKKGVKVAGGEEESIFQPEWGPDGALYFVSDRTGYWNLYRWENGEVQPLLAKDAEFGQPAWLFGFSTYAFVPSGSGFDIICAYTQRGTEHFARLDLNQMTLKEIQTPFTSFRNLQAAKGSVAMIAGSPSTSPAVLKYDLEKQKIEALKRSRKKELDPAYISVPQMIEFPTSDNRKAYAFFYPPTNKDFKGPESEKPPLIVKSHGGPTSFSPSILNPEVQYWTSRGIGVVDVNYGGSTGFGREYRKRLNDNWGIVDVDDGVNAALFLAKKGEADENRLAIKGGSAGGYTTLSALTFTDVFRAGASYYGVSDLEALAKDTHKFESRYLDKLVGAYPEKRDIYLERSPIHHTDKFSCPVIILQGDEDEIVPPNQAERMFEAVKKKGLMTAYLLFKGEQHGIRAAKNIKKALEAESYFYSQVFGYKLADDVEPIPIENR